MARVKKLRNVGSVWLHWTVKLIRASQPSASSPLRGTLSSLLRCAIKALLGSTIIASAHFAAVGYSYWPNSHLIPSTGKTPLTPIKTSHFSFTHIVIPRETLITRVLHFKNLNSQSYATLILEQKRTNGRWCFGNKKFFQIFF